MTPIAYRTRADTFVVALALLALCVAPCAWCQEGARILFGGGEADGATNIYMTTPVGEPPEQLTFYDGKRDWAYYPAWSPNGRHIAFSANREWVTPRIYVMDSDGNNQVLVSEGGGWDHGPTWSPRGNAVAFWSTRWPTTQGVYVTDLEGGPDIRLTELGTVGSHPHWRPVGDAVVYSSYSDGAQDIHVMDGGGRPTARVTGRPRTDGQPGTRTRK